MIKKEDFVENSVVSILEKTASDDNISKNNLDAIKDHTLSEINDNGTIRKFLIVQIEGSWQASNLIEPFCWHQQYDMSMNEMPPENSWRFNNE